ncbi:MAG: GntR family transcriptional regulator [Polyangiales bacterium]
MATAEHEVKTRAVEEVTSRLRAAILRGEFPAGTSLPGERDLATQQGVSRLTLRAAIGRLETEGLLRAVHGSGTRVLDWRERGGIELVSHLAALDPAGFPALLRDLLEVRRVLAVEAIALAARRCDADDLADLRELVTRQALLVEDPAGYIAADLAVARRLARATRNVALVLLANTVTGMLERQPAMAVAFLVDAPGTLRFYRRVLQLLASRDGERARALASRLIDRVDRSLLARVAALFDPNPNPIPNGAATALEVSP